MNNDITELIIEIKTSLARVETKLDSVQTTLANHENRISKIEHDQHGKPDSGFKDNLLQLLAKAVLVSICGFATLAGAGSVIAKILGN